MKSISDAINDVNNQLTEESPTKTDSVIIYNSLRPDKLLRLSLAGRSINSVRDFSSRTEISHITELDLNRNFIHSWEDVTHILCHLDKLKFLDLSFNPLESAEDSHLLRRASKHPNLTELVLNATRIPLSTARQVIEICPNLVKLWLCLNDYNNLISHNYCQASYPSVKELYLAGNKIKDSRDINQFCSLFPKLDYLSLRENPVTDLAGLTKESVPKGINLCQTLIGDWANIICLNKFPNFSVLQLVNVPLLEKLPKEIRRDMCIAELPGLRILNKTPITEKEREKAERFFIRMCMKTNEKPERFYQLQKIHGELNPLLELDLSPPKTISIRLECDGFPERTVSVELVKSVSYLRGLVYRELFDNNREIKFKMFHISVGIPGEMKLPQKQLYTFRIVDGDIILVVVLCRTCKNIFLQI